MLKDLAVYHNELLEMAKKFDNRNFDDLLQETYLALHDTGKSFNEINTGYIYTVMRSIFIKDKKNNKEIPFEDFSYFENEETINKEFHIKLELLTKVERQIYYAYFGQEVVNNRNEIINKIEGVNLSKLSRETGIPYRTIYYRFNGLKRKLCKDLEMQLRY